MLLASNRSMSYLRPYGWFKRVLNIFKCRQCVDIETQYERYGVRCFDIKIYPTFSGRMEFTNGSITYITFSVYEVLNYLNKKGDCYVMLTFDDVQHWDFNRRAETRFREYCHIVEQIYPNIRFFGGRSSKDGSRIYYFDYERINGKPIIIDFKGSAPSWMKEDSKWFRFIHRVFPHLYAKLRNKTNFVNTLDRDDHVIYFTDFVDVGIFN